MHILFAGGGTAGHINPALSVAKYLEQNYDNVKISYIGTKKGLENDLVPKAGYELRHVKISGIKRSLSPKNLITAVRLFTSQAEAKKLIREFRPDIVIGTGGYACWPCVKVAAAMGIPTMLHEANATPGLAVKKLVTKIDTLLTNFDETKDRISGCSRVVKVGMPMRGEFERISKAEAREKLGLTDKEKYVILSFGGSLGAPMVNRASLEVMRDLSSTRDDIVHYHSTGSREYENSSALFKEWKLEGHKNLHLAPYIYDMSYKMAAADLVICRSGAMTLAELTRMGVPAILIPSPNVTDNHQYKNAKVLADAGAAIIIEEKDFDGECVTNAARVLIDNDAKRRAMGESISSFCDKETSKKIFFEIERLIKKKR